MMPSAFERWFGRTSTIVALGALAVAIFLPPHGVGIPFCWLNRMTGIPCPGCGMMRSLSSAARGMFKTSFEYHPFGLILLVCAVLVALVAVSPARYRHAVERWMDRNEVVFRWATNLFLGAFVVFGAVRAALHIYQRMAGA